MSRIILPPGFILPLTSFCPHIILPPGNLLMYTIFPFLYHFAPYHFAPYHLPLPPIILPPWKLFHDLNYLPMSSIIMPPGLVLPPYHFAPYHFAPWKWFNDLHYIPMSRIILPPALHFVFILIKSPLQQKLMTGAHPVTVAPLVITVIGISWGMQSSLQFCSFCYICVFYEFFCHLRLAERLFGMTLSGVCPVRISSQPLVLVTLYYQAITCDVFLEHYSLFLLRSSLSVNHSEKKCSNTVYWEFFASGYFGENASWKVC